MWWEFDCYIEFSVSVVISTAVRLASPSVVPFGSWSGMEVKFCFRPCHVLTLFARVSSPSISQNIAQVRWFFQFPIENKRVCGTRKRSNPIQLYEPEIQCIIFVSISLNNKHRKENYLVICISIPVSGLYFLPLSFLY